MRSTFTDPYGLRNEVESRPMTGRMSGKQGFTLLEMMIVLAIFSTVMMGAISVLTTGQESYNVGAIKTGLENDALRVMDLLTESLPECRIITSPQDSNNYTMLAFQVPVVSGTAYWDSLGSIYWGAADNVGWCMVYVFVADQTMNEAADTRDYNEDGDMADIFERGRIVLRIYNSTVLDDANIVQEIIMGHNFLVMLNPDDPNYPVSATTDRNGDFNMDGEPDPIFVRIDGNYTPSTVPPYGDSPGLGNRIRINLFLVTLYGQAQEAIWTNAKIDVALLNPQQ